MPRVRFTLEGLQAEVPVGSTILEAAQSVGAPEGSHCGGVAACSTCHVHVQAGAELLSEPDEDELDLLEGAWDRRPDSRLGCQARLLADGDVRVAISEESFQTWLDSHPRDRRRALALRGLDL